MGIKFLQPSMHRAVGRATSQVEQVSTILGAFPGNWTLKYKADATVASVVTHLPAIPDNNTPRGFTIGTMVAFSVIVPDVEITELVFNNGTEDVFSLAAADISSNPAGPLFTRVGRRLNAADNLSQLIIKALASLPVLPPALLTFTLADTGSVGVAVAGSIVNSGGVSADWSITPPANCTVTPSSGTLAAGGTQAISVTATVAATYGLTLVSAGVTIVNSAQNLVISSGVVVPTTATLSLPSSATTSVAISGSITLNQVADQNYTASLSISDGGTLSTASPVVLTGQTVIGFTASWPAAGAGRTVTLNSMSPTLTVAGSPRSVTVSAVVPTTATLSGSTTATEAVAQNYTVTLDQPADQTYTITWSRSDSGTGSATSTITSGQTSASASSTWAVAGAGRTVDFTISPSLTRAGRPITVTVNAPGVFTFSFADAATINTGRNTTTELATNVPPGAIAEVSPDLLPGQTLSLTGGVLSIVGDSTVPTVSPTSADPILAAVADIEFHHIEVMDNPIATIRNATKNITYEYAAPGSWPQYDGQTSNRWNAVWGQMDIGDVIEISPGAVQAEANDASHYYSNSLDSCGLHISKPGTFKNMAGRGRWRVWPANVTLATNRNGIGIYSPIDTGIPRGDFVLEGFDITDQFLTDGAGVRSRSAGLTNGSWAGYQASITLRNFKIGRTTGKSLSGVSGSAEVMTMEDGHIFDCGNGSGQEHNIYVTARLMTLQGVRFSRTRGWEGGTPYGTGTVSLEGHILKVSAVTGLVEGCVIDCAPMGDQSELLQMKAGGNWTVRGNLFIDSQGPNNANGAILMCREYGQDGVTPNFEWWAGSEGNSLLFEKNVYIGHYPRPPIWFYAQASVSAMRPAVGGAWSAAERLDSLVVRDNIAMVATVQPYGAWMLSGFPGVNNAMWIHQDPNSGANWGDRGNSVMTYGTDEPGFSADDKQLLIYRRAAGALSGNGPVSTKRFVYPHGWVARTDSFQGLA